MAIITYWQRYQWQKHLKCEFIKVSQFPVRHDLKLLAHSIFMLHSFFYSIVLFISYEITKIIDKDKNKSRGTAPQTAWL